MTTARAPLSIDVVSDVVCPWCFIGKRRLERALALRPEQPVTLRWRPFQLDPTVPAAGVERRAYMEQKFGPDRIEAIHERIAAAGAEVGVAFAFDRIALRPNTLAAHRLIRWAAEARAQDAIVERLFTLYFCEGADIGDLDVLARVAGAAGLDEAATRRRLATDEDAAAVLDEIAVAVRIGVSGVPFFIFAGKYGASGAQPEDALAAAMDQAAADARA